MICSSCGGNVTWRGPMSNLTHTECAGCGAQNNQIVDPLYDDEETEDDSDNSAAVACNQYLIKSYRGSDK